MPTFLEMIEEATAGLEPHEPGPEAKAAWEWLQKACTWKMG
jgi:hypothetical protein